MKRDVLVVSGITLAGLITVGTFYALRKEAERPTSGFVVFESGAPCDVADVTWRRVGGTEGWLANVKRPSGRFWARTPEGEVVLRAQIPGGMPGEEVTVEAGRRNVRLVVPDGEQFSLRFEPWGEETHAFATIVGRSASGTRTSTSVPVDDDGRVRLAGQDPGEARDVFFQSLTTCRGAWVQGLLPGPEEKVVRLVKAEPIEGRLVLPPGKVDPWVHLAGWLGEDATISGDRFSIPCVPPGTWRIVASTRRGEEYWEAKAEARAGATDVEIRLVLANGP